MNKLILVLGLGCSAYWAWISYMVWFHPEVELAMSLATPSALCCVLTLFNTFSSSVILGPNK